MCGRYISHKQVEGDIDDDGNLEIIACVTYSEKKTHQYRNICFQHGTGMTTI